MGHKPYTPELHQLGLTLHAWHTIIKWKEGKHVHSRYLRRLAEQCDIPYYKLIPLEECRKERALQFRKYKDYSENDMELKRISFFDTLADAVAEAGNISKSAAISQLKSREELRHGHKEIRSATNDFLGAPYHKQIRMNLN